MEEALIKRVMPNSLEAEQSVIGAMLMDSDAAFIASEIVCADDFYHSVYGLVFEAMVELLRAGKVIDLITVQEKLREKGAPQEVVGMEFVKNLLNVVPTSANIKYYADIVAEKSFLRKLIRLNDEISGACYAGTEPVTNIMEKTEQSVFHLLKNKTGDEYVPIKEIVLTALDQIDKAARNRGAVTGVPTGFTDLDYKLSGLQNSDLILVAARPAMGKTAFVLNIAQYVSIKKNKGVLLFSLEMSKEQLVNRLISLESHVEGQSLRTGMLKREDWSKLVEGAQSIASSKMIIDDTPGISVSAMRTKCRKYMLQKEKEISLIIVDYLQLMTGGAGARAESRQQEISEISRSLKALARELRVPVVVLSQLNRGVESRQDKRPMLSDLRESGAIEQDADVVMFLYRDEYYNMDTKFKNQAEVIIAKQRNGPTGTISLAWLSEYTKFANLAREEH